VGPLRRARPGRPPGRPVNSPKTTRCRWTRRGTRSPPPTLSGRQGNTPVRWAGSVCAGSPSMSPAPLHVAMPRSTGPVLGRRLGRRRRRQACSPTSPTTSTSPPGPNSPPPCSPGPDNCAGVHAASLATRSTAGANCAAVPADSTSTTPCRSAPVIRSPPRAAVSPRPSWPHGCPGWRGCGCSPATG
jgi:hypothetical protein